jgi:hypothetical protein
MKPCVILDMDGTLADVSSIRHYVRARPKDFDAFHEESVNVPPHEEAVGIAELAYSWGYDVVVVTARRARWRHHTAWWLAMHNVPSDALFMRGDKDNRSDVEVKRDILAMIRCTWHVHLAVDDNPNVIALWESENIPTIVIPGWEH